MLQRCASNLARLFTFLKGLPRPQVRRDGACLFYVRLLRSVRKRKDTMARYPTGLLEEELKNKVAADWFAAYDTTRIIGKVDFCVAIPATELGLYEAENALLPTTTFASSSRA